MSIECDQIDAIEACRTCGVYYMSSTNYLKPLFQCAVEYPEMMLIRFELAQWKLEVSLWEHRHTHNDSELNVTSLFFIGK